MLPKPNFGSNPAKPVLNNPFGQSSGQNWFQYEPNRSMNGFATNNYTNNFSNGYNAFGNAYPQMGQNLWPQNNSNSGHMWSRVQSQSNNNNQNNGPQYQRNGFQQNKRFKNFEPKSSDLNANQFNRSNKSFNCDTCCRWFPTQDQYDQHISEHIMCGLDECTFRAHPKVIESHQRMQHFCFKDKTLVKKFMTLETEEDIEKWREERRKNFPTKDSIKRKQESKETKPKIDKNKTPKRVSDTLEDKECDPRHDSDGRDAASDAKQESKLTDNRKNKKKKWNKGGKRLDIAFGQRDRQNNRKLTLFQKLMAMDEQRDDHKVEESTQLTK